MKKNILILIVILLTMGFFNITSLRAETVAECVQDIESRQNIEPLNEISAGITPKNIFYFLDGFGDWIKLHLFSFTTDAQINTLLEQAQERVAELESLQQSNDLSLLHINTITESYNSIMDQLDLEVQGLVESNKDISDILARVTKLNAKNNLIISQLMVRVGVSNFTPLSGVYNSTKDSLCATIDLWQDVITECNDSAFISQKLSVYYNDAINEIADLDASLEQISTDQAMLTDYYDQVSGVVNNINTATALLNNVIDSGSISITDKESIISSFIADVNSDGNYSNIKNSQPNSAELVEYGLSGVLATANTSLINILNRLEDLTAVDNDQGLASFVGDVLALQSDSAESRLASIQSLSDNIGQDRANLLSSKNSCQALRSKFLKISDALEDSKLTSATVLLNNLQTEIDDVVSDLLPRCGVGGLVDFLSEVFAESTVLNSDGQCQSEQYLHELGQWSRNQLAYWDETISYVDDLADKVGEQQTALGGFINGQQTAVSIAQNNAAQLSQRPTNSFNINEFYSFDRGWLTDEVVDFQDQMAALGIEMAILQDDLQNAQIIVNNLQNNVLVAAQNNVNQLQSEYDQLTSAVQILTQDIVQTQAQVAISQASFENATAGEASSDHAVQSASSIVTAAELALEEAQAAYDAMISNDDLNVAVKNGVDYYYTTAKSPITNGIYFGGLGSFITYYTFDLPSSGTYNFWVETLNYPVDMAKDGYNIPLRLYYTAQDTTQLVYWSPIINNPASNPEMQIATWPNKSLIAGTYIFKLYYAVDRTLPTEVSSKINMLINRVGIDSTQSGRQITVSELENAVTSAQTALNNAQTALNNAQNNYDQALLVLDSAELNLEVVQQSLATLLADLMEQQELVTTAEEELEIAHANLSDLVDNQIPAAQAEVINLQNQVSNFADILASGSAEDIINQEMKADIIKQEINTIVNDSLSGIASSYQDLVTELSTYQNTVAETIALYSDLATELVAVNQSLNNNQLAQAKQQINNILFNSLQDLKTSEYAEPAYFIGHNLNVLQWLIDIDQLDFARQDLYLAEVRDAFVQLRELSCPAAQQFYNTGVNGFCSISMNNSLSAGCDYMTNLQMLITEACTTGRQDYCGDGIIDSGETCDDFNDVSGDGCGSTCQNEILYYCGDGIIQTPNSLGINEECENTPPNQFDDDGCSAQCQNENEAYCGDGILQQPNDDGFMERCDDGNRFASDGCNNLCVIERGQNSGIIIKSIRP
ncbi:MAG: hypothetical protein AUJ28_02440 [Parcubacteria group bacterium CG1_02_37_51]|uniref:DUF5667 domain-containing protein n=1 Tax=Candidatus Komeilibacteria bacterium CG_4_10_14_0_8_um_filter_37_78 TaxID=1974471 RepID=A0A2M7RBT5_9BACT|nr:MAG: hypothetical protein AUJ28_02440 [Parcubacteria group bacterium CG1_02_37_51]PIY94233.1 MAG: hypothetical protein COY67_02765 [Candidatus Komeilibacteria bacterium CG_4_10_14_0_8_um_filter_37_78]